MIKFKSDATLVNHNIDALKAVLSGNGLLTTVNGIHEIIEKTAKRNLLDSSNSTGNPQATKRSIYGYDRMVANNITSVVTKRGHKIIGGTGNVAYMDKVDPLNKLRGLNNPQIRLWRILEWGVSPFNTLRAKNPNKPMVFWWRRKNVLFIGKTKRIVPKNGTFIPLPTYSEPIEHPGQLGRFYWLKTELDAETEFRLKINEVLSGIIRAHSGKGQVRVYNWK